MDHDDYGIDREVEVFENDTTTGLTFKVQLKGSDGSGDSIRAKRATVNYWKTLDVPVLIVSYSTKTKRMRGRWAHTIGADITGSGADKTTIKMDPSFELSDQWTDGLADDLRLVRELRRGIVPRPLPAAFRVEDGLGFDTDQLAAEVLRMSRTSGWPIRAVKPGEHAVRVEVEPTRIRVALPLLWGSANWHVQAGWNEGFTLHQICQLVLQLAAAAHANVNEDATRELAFAAGADSPFWMVEEIGAIVGPILAAGDAHQFLFDITHTLSQVGLAETVEAVEWYTTLLHDSLEEIDDDQFEEFSAARRRLIADTAPEDPNDAGRQSYNLAHLHKSRRDYDTSVDLFREAARLAPRYQTDPLMLRHLGGALWECQRYQESADVYRQALTHGFPRQELAPLLADSLMRAGKYAEATEELTGWQPTGEERDRVGIIRKVVLEHVGSVVGVGEQDRMGVDPNEHLNKVVNILESEDEPSGQLLELLRTEDALSPTIWSVWTTPDDPVKSFLPALITATVTERLAPVWVVALLCGLAADVETALLEAICNQARLLCGDDFYDVAQQAADAQDDPAKTDQIRRVLAATYSRDAVAHGYTLRFVDRDAETDWIIHEEWFGKPGAVPPQSAFSDRSR